MEHNTYINDHQCTVLEFKNATKTTLQDFQVWSSHKRHLNAWTPMTWLRLRPFMFETAPLLVARLGFFFVGKLIQSSKGFSIFCLAKCVSHLLQHRSRLPNVKQTDLEKCWESLSSTFLSQCQWSSTGSWKSPSWKKDTWHVLPCLCLNVLVPKSEMPKPSACTWRGKGRNRGIWNH